MTDVMEVFKEANLECSNNNNNNNNNNHTLVVGIQTSDPAEPLDSLVTRTLEISLLSPCSPPPVNSESECILSEASAHHQPPSPESTALFAQKLQMKLKSHLETSASSDSSSSSEEFYTNSSATNEEDTTSSNSEIFYDFDDVVYDEELTSDYGTGGSNSTVVASRSSSGSSSSGSSVVVDEQDGGSNKNKITNDCNNDRANGPTGDSSKDVGNEEEVEDAQQRAGGGGVRYQRSSSLKSGKTPPGTPMKKIVRFADAMGLDLIDIKVFLDEIPKVPKEAYRDLHIPDYTGPSSTSPNTTSSSDYARSFFSSVPRTSSTLNFVPLFHQPVTMPDFFDKIRDQKVLLENAYLTQETVSSSERSSQCKQVIKGTVRVMNIDFHKSVYVRYTYNDWKEFVDFQATYMPGSCDGFSDRFEFRIEIDESRLPPPYVKDHDDAKVAFACRFHCQGSQFWDNNQSRNYVFQNVPSNSSSRSTLLTGYYDEFDYTDLRSPSDPYTTSPVVATLPAESLPATTTTTTTSSSLSLSSCVPVTIQQQQETPSPSYSSGGGGGSHLSSSLYSPSSTMMSFYDHAYGSYQFGSACFY